MANKQPLLLYFQELKNTDTAQSKVDAACEQIFGQQGLTLCSVSSNNLWYLGKTEKLMAVKKQKSVVYYDYDKMAWRPPEITRLNFHGRPPHKI